MAINFERGDPGRPKGHALAYFRTYSEPDKVYATYIIVLPIQVDFAKYVPPFLTSHLSNMPLSDLSAFSLPPVPEEVGSFQELLHLAEVRDDDLLDAGTFHSFDLPEMMQTVSDVVQQYSQIWADHTKPALAAKDTQNQGSSSTDEDSPSVNEVLYGLMSQGDKLAELSKMIGKLRFAVEGNDQQTGSDIEEDIKILSRHLPEHYAIPSLLEAVLNASANGAQLAQLYLDRCYKLSSGDDVGARSLEEQIESLKTSS